MPYIGGVRQSPDALFEYIRINIKCFIDSSQPHFTPHPDLPGEVINWQNHMLGTVLSIDIPIDNGSVILSDYDHRHWTFSTIQDRLNGAHPVSGNRSFEYSYFPANFLGNGLPEQFLFGVTGADRINYRAAELAGLIRSGTLNPASAFQFSAGDRLWTSMQNRIAAFVNSHGGTAQVQAPTMNRPNWQAVRTALDNGESLIGVPCD